MMPLSPTSKSIKIIINLSLIKQPYTSISIYLLSTTSFHRKGRKVYPSKKKKLQTVVSPRIHDV